MMPTKQGMAVCLPVSTLSMRTLRDVFAALVRADHSLIAHLIDEVEAHVRDGSGAVEAALGLHLA